MEAAAASRRGGIVIGSCSGTRHSALFSGGIYRTPAATDRQSILAALITNAPSTAPKWVRRPVDVAAAAAAAAVIIGAVVVANVRRQ